VTGIGINAVQGAAHAGATRVIAVDPVRLKRETALTVGATDAVESIEAATELARALTNGQGADASIVTVGLLSPDHIAQAFESVRKGGIVVVTSAAPMREVGIPISLFMLTMYEKRLQGCLYGMMSPSAAVPRFIDMYEQGQLKLDELVSKTYPIEEINSGYDDMYAGVNIRGLLDFAGRG
jgi:Zn-dependent alcohol dehydrogenase